MSIQAVNRLRSLITAASDPKTEALKKKVARASIKYFKNFGAGPGEGINYRKLVARTRKLADMWEKRANRDPAKVAKQNWKRIWSEFVASPEFKEAIQRGEDINESDLLDWLSSNIPPEGDYQDGYDGDVLQEAHDFLRDYT